VLGFESQEMAVTAASAISQNFGMGEVTQFDENTQDILSEFTNTVVRRALTAWDSLGLPARFSTPHVADADEVHRRCSADTEAYVVLLTHEFGEVRFHVTFTKSIANSLHGKRVLVTDDSKVIRRMLRNELEKVGMEVYEAENGREAVEKYADVAPHATIMDVVMPEMTGLEATKLICEMDDTAKIMVLTSTSRREEIVAARDAGAMNYLLKPVQIPLLLDVLRDAIG